MEYLKDSCRSRKVSPYFRKVEKSKPKKMFPYFRKNSKVSLKSDDSSCLREISEYVYRAKETKIKANSLLQKVSTVEESSVDHAN
ncbi:hypothetical protein TSUD_208640 [Trifolium subterraneum]|uniref:Uncharacterized protein n=1 Tax=Trifolium subterraneum TaxID=3900 RepID=A0A2Z6MZQ3_TRISU|nr:hypothetical protein TSUD_208640 [Trifolium subterraneum]